MSHEPTGHDGKWTPLVDATLETGEEPSAPALDAMRIVLPGASSPVPVEDAEHVELRRPALVDAISRAIAEVPAERRRRRLWTMSGRFVLAAAVLFAVGAASTFVAVRMSNGSAVAVGAGTAAQGELARIERFDADAVHAATSATVGEASTLVTSASERLVATLPGHTVVEVAPRSRVILARLPVASQELILDRGIVSVDVPEAAAPERGPEPGGSEPSRRRVRVTTPEAVVEVKGTQFDVVVADAPGGGEVTTVKVKRGRVLVTEGARRTFVGAGETWTSAPLYGARGGAAPRDAGAASGEARHGPRSDERTAAAQAPSRPVAAAQNPTLSSDGSADSPARGGDPASTLAEQNRLLEAAVAAERQGNRREAARLLESLLARFPDSPHRASALSRLRDLDRPNP